MTTQKQIEANRRNAKQSTGPKSTKGKAVTKLNALKHGILAKQVLIPGEIQNEFFDLRQRFLDDLKPDGILERELVDQMVTTFWRLRRVRQVEAGIFVIAFRRQRDETEDILVRKEYNMNPTSMEIGQHDKFNELWALGDTFKVDADRSNAFTKLSRYETTLQRSLQRDLHELHRLQAMREGAEVQTPIAVDVTIDGALPMADNEP